MHATVSWMMGGSTRMPCFQITTSFARDCCTEAAHAACQCEHMGSKHETYHASAYQHNKQEVRKELSTSFLLLLGYLNSQKQCIGHIC